MIAASIFVAAGVENGAGLSLFVRGKYGLYGYHTFQFEPLDQWINGYRNNGNANFKAIDSHGTVSWIRFLHQRMLLMNRTIEILCLQKRGKVKLDNPIP